MAKKIQYICDFCDEEIGQMMYEVALSAQHQGTVATAKKDACADCKEKFFPIVAM